MRVSQAFVHEAETIKRFRRLGRDYLESRVAAQRLVAIYFPFVQFLSGVADAIVLGRRGRADRLGPPHLGRPDRLHPLHRPVLLADPAALPGLRLLAADPGLGGPDRRPHAARDAHPAGRRTRSCPGRLAGRHHPRPRPLRLPRSRDRSDRGVAGEPAPSGAGPKDPRFLQAADAAPHKPPEALRGIDLHIAAGETVALVGRDRGGEVDGDEAAGPLLRPRPGRRARRRPRPALARSPRLPPPARLRAPGGLPLHRHHPRQHRLRPARRGQRRGGGGGPGRGAHDFIADLPGATCTSSRSGAARSRPGSAS